MLAITADRYGPPSVLDFRETDRPVYGDDQVLLRVRASSVNPYDWHVLRGEPFLVRSRVGWLKPIHRVPGVDVAGVVEAVGENVTEFRPGDEVFGAAAGAYAQYVAAPVDGIVRKPAGVSFEQAAAIPLAGYTALQGLRDVGQLREGQKVLINGASGGVGTLAVQIARAHGAEVTGVCSTANVEMVHSLGAHHVIDYTAEDFARQDGRYDLMLDNVGNRRLSECRRVLRPDGRYVAVGAQAKSSLGILLHLLKLSLASFGRKPKMVVLLARCVKRDLEVLRDLMEAGKLTPVIGRSYDLPDTPDAIRHVEGGHARGKTVITVGAAREPGRGNPT